MAKMRPGKEVWMDISKWAIGLAAVLSACSPNSPDGQRSKRLNGPLFSALIFSKTTGFRHYSIPNGIDAITELGAANGFNVEATGDSSLFTDENLAKYRMMI